VLFWPALPVSREQEPVLPLTMPPACLPACVPACLRACAQSHLAISDLETQLPTVLQVLPHEKVGELPSCSVAPPRWMDGATGRR
jgi:hypothetical protein